MRADTDSAQEHGLLEREGELRRLDAALAAGAGGGGRPLVVVGPAGIGKTSLLARARGAARERGFRVLAASGTELEGALPFGVCRQLFDPVLAGAGAGERERLLAGAAALAGRLLLAPPGGAGRRDDGEPRQPGAPSAAPLEPRRGEAAFAFLHGLYWLSANLAEGAPLLLTVDDAHWADAPSLRFLDYLGRRLDGLPVVTVTAARETEPGGGARDLLRSLLDAPAVEVLRPAPLGEEAGAALIGASLGAAPAAEFTAACRRATQGNPFYLTELLRALRAAHIAPSARGARSVSAVGPAAISREVLGRVARLPAGCLELVRALAVLGERAQLREAAALAGLDGAEEAAADALCAAGVLVGGPSLAFSHPILRAAVYEDIPPQERAAAHAAAAALLAGRGAPDAEVAAHLLRTAPAAEATTRAQLRAAADVALDKGDPATAISYLRRALDEAPPAAEGFELRLELGTALAGAGDPEGIDMMRAALRAAPDAAARARVAIPLSAALIFAGRATEAVEALDQVLAEPAGAVGDRSLVAQLEALLRVMAITDLEARRRLRDRLPPPAAAALHPPGELGAPALAPLAIELIFAGAPAEEVASVARRALGEGELQNGVAATSPLPVVAAYGLIAAGDPRRAERALDAALERAGRDAIPSGITVAAAARSLARLRRGNLRGAQADAETCIRLGDERRPEVFLPIAVSTLALAHLERGELEAAREALAGPGLAGLRPSGVLTQPLVECRARVSLAEGDCEAALRDLERCREWAAAWGESSGSWPVQWRATMALAELRRGNGGAARELADQDLELARRFGEPRAVGVALLAAGLCASGARGRELLHEAAGTLAGCGDRLEHARAAVELGAALRRAGRRSQAREPLAAGMKAARACGATALAERAYEELRATGARPRKILYSGLDALTPSELRVARMALRGMTNREIAQALFVTPKTVEVHLGHTYQKLDISSRSQLPAALAADEVQAG